MATLQDYEDSHCCPDHGFIPWQTLQDRSIRAKVSAYIESSLMLKNYRALLLTQLLLEVSWSRHRVTHVSDVNTDIIPEYTLLANRKDTEYYGILLRYSVQ